MFAASNVHSIDFFYDDPINEVAEGRHVNTWDDWHLVATSRPTISPPEFKENNVEITGMSGFVDVSRVLTGYPLYGAREGSIEFMVLNQYNLDSADYWTEVYHKVAHFLHGQRRKMVLHDDERNYYYDGIFTVESFESGDYNSTITINYILQPYKKARRLSNEEWIWDPFDLDYGIIMNQKFKGLTVDQDVSGSDWPFDEYVSDYIGEEPVVPEIIVTFTLQYDSGPDTRTFVFPDVNGDGFVDARDATEVKAEYTEASTSHITNCFKGVYKNVPHGDEAPVFAENTYYELYESSKGDKYILLTTAPSDWASKWYEYYYQLLSPEEQFDRADADRNGKVSGSDASFILGFYGSGYSQDLTGWTEYMTTHPVEIPTELWLYITARTVEGRSTNFTLRLDSDGSYQGSDPITVVMDEELSDNTKRVFRVTSPRCVLYGEIVRIMAKGHATFDISFREGRL